MATSTSYKPKFIKNQKKKKIIIAYKIFIPLNCFKKFIIEF